MAGGVVDVGAVRRMQFPASSWVYTERDVMLYALGVGCTWDEPRYVYENSAAFCALPTFGVLTPYHGVLAALPLHRLLPNFDPTLVLHGEQYLELKRAFPTAGTLLTTPRIIDIQDKGKAAVVVIEATSINADTQEVVAINEITTFVRGAGGFGTRHAPAERRLSTVAKNAPPNRMPDAVVEERTSPELAAIYRLSGDYNPLHIDADFAAVGGFDKPILHGLCTFGISAKHVLKTYGAGDPESIRSIKGRFAKHVFPGECLRTEMWVESPSRVVFQTKVVERNALVISNAAVELHGEHLAVAKARL